MGADLADVDLHKLRVPLNLRHLSKEYGGREVVQRSRRGSIAADRRRFVTIDREVPVACGEAPPQHASHVFDIHLDNHASVTSTGRERVVVGFWVR